MAPTNITAATATFLPEGVWTQDTSGATGPLYEVWYGYLPTEAAEVILGVWIHAPVANTYTPTVTIYTGTPSALSILPWFDRVANTALMVPVTVGVPLYFRVTQRVAGGVPDTSLIIDFLKAPQLPVPRGSILVPDETPGFPMAFISQTTGAILGYRRFPAGEFGEVLPTGEIMVQNVDDEGADPPDFGDGAIDLYTPAFVRTATVPYPHFGTPPSTSNRVNRFYIGDPEAGLTPATITAITLDGVIERVWVLPQSGMRGLAVSVDETIAYYTGALSSIGTAIKQWDLVNSVALPDLVAPLVPLAVYNKDLLRLNPGGLIVPYVNSVGGLPFINRYDLAGVLQATYSLPTRSEHLSHAVDDTTFWVWMQPDHHRFQEISVATGAVVHDLVVPMYTAGICIDGETDTPLGRFGASQSCPFLISQVDFGGTTPDQPGEPGEPDETPTTVGCPITFPVDPGGGGCGGPMAVLP